MSKLNLLILNILILVIINSNNANSCSCISLNNLSLKEKIREAYSEESNIFTCKILSKTEVLIQDTFYMKDRAYYGIPTYMLCCKAIIIKNYKGIFSNDTIKIYTGLGNGDCGFNFEINNKYLVYSAYTKYSDGRIDTNLSTNICKRTQLLDENKSKLELVYLEKLAKKKIKK